MLITIIIGPPCGFNKLQALKSFGCLDFQPSIVITAENGKFLVKDLQKCKNVKIQEKLSGKLLGTVSDHF